MEKSLDPPAWANHLWWLYSRIFSDRDAALKGVALMKIRDIVGAARAYGIDLTPFEVEAIQTIDREYVAVQNGRHSNA